MPTDPLHPEVPEAAQFDPKDWLWTVAAKKGVTLGAKSFASWLIAHKYAGIAAHVLAVVGAAAGIPIVPDPAMLEAALTALGTSGLGLARNWLKIKTAWGAKYL